MSSAEVARKANRSLPGPGRDDEPRAVCGCVAGLRSEAFGVSLLEGAMYAKPLISCEIGTGTSFVNIDGETGLVAPPSDPSALRAAMDALWQSPREPNRWAHARPCDTRTHFTARNMAEANAALYSELVETARRM